MKKGTMKPETIIKKYGYEYHLVETVRLPEVPEPAFMGIKGMALKSVKKIKA